MQEGASNHPARKPPPASRHRAVADVAQPVCSALQHEVTCIIQSSWHSTVLQKECKQGDHDGVHCHHRLIIPSPT
jgi:hypothetical protein